MDINQRINGSWLDQDAYRHWCYERIYSVYQHHQFLGDHLRAIEFGSLQPTTPPLRMLKHIYGDRIEVSVGQPYPEDDVTRHLHYEQDFDYVIVDQVLEHVTQKEEAIFNLSYLLKPGGLLLVAMPFLYPVHNCPVDVSRLTPLGMRLLLEGTAENPTGLEVVECDSWGGLSVYRWWLDHLTSWVPIERAMIECPGFRTPEYGSDWPMIVWGIARKK